MPDIFEYAKARNVAIDEEGYTYVVRGIVYSKEDELENAGAKFSYLGWTFDKPSYLFPTYKLLFKELLIISGDSFKYNYDKLFEFKRKILVDDDMRANMNKAILALYDIQVDNDFYTYFYKKRMERLDGMYSLDKFYNYYKVVNGNKYYKVHINEFCDFDNNGIIKSVNINKKFLNRVWFELYGADGWNFPTDENVLCGKQEFNLIYIDRIYQYTYKPSWAYGDIKKGNRYIFKDSAGRYYLWSSSRKLTVNKGESCRFTALLLGEQMIDNKLYYLINNVKFIKE